MISKRIKRVMTVSILFNLLFIIFSIAAIVYKGGIPWVLEKLSISTMNENVDDHYPYYYDRTSLFDMLDDKNNEIVFLGDSITDGCEWSELFNNPNIVNRGISKDTTQGVLDRIDQIISDHAKKIFIMIGINDLCLNIDSKTMINNYNQILKKINEESKDTEIYLQSILPLDKYGKIVGSNDITDINGKLKEFSEKYKNCYYIDLYSKFANGNLMDSQYTNDGLHLNGNGYLLWKACIEKYIK